jgi:hypothetical protein
MDTTTTRRYIRTARIFVETLRDLESDPIKKLRQGAFIRSAEETENIIKSCQPEQLPLVAKEVTKQEFATPEAATRGLVYHFTDGAKVL